MKTVHDVVAKYVKEIGHVSADGLSLSDSGRSFTLSDEDRDVLFAAMHASAAADAEYRAAEGVEIPDGDFAEWGKWHRAANRLLLRDGVCGGSCAWRVLMTAVREQESR